MTSATAVDVMEDANTVLQSIAAITGKVISVYEPDEMNEKAKGMVFPGAGLVYEGLISVPSSGPSERLGNSAEMRFAIVLVMRKETIVRTDVKSPMILLLQEIRTLFLNRRSPTGHKYGFVVEAPAEVKGGTTLWIQRWRVPIQLPVSN